MILWNQIKERYVNQNKLIPKCWQVCIDGLQPQTQLLQSHTCISSVLNRLRPKATPGDTRARVPLCFTTVFILYYMLPFSLCATQCLFLSITKWENLDSQRSKIMIVWISTAVSCFFEHSNCIEMGQENLTELSFLQVSKLLYPHRWIDPSTVI